jgi:trk system potassium uptake protein TrkH
MNYRLLSRLFGVLLFFIAAAMLVCLGFEWAFGETYTRADATEAFVLSAGITALTGMVLLALGAGASEEVLRKEAIAVVGLGWVICAVFGALPYMFCEPRLGFVAAVFESMSGFTTTGSTVIPDLDLYPRSILLYRSLTQWLGGMGILVLFVALLSYLGVGSKALFHHESSARSGGGLQARIHDVALRLWQIYLGLSIACFAGLMLLGMSFYDAVCHAFATVSTGGFSPHNESVAAFDSLGIELWLSLFMLLGSVSFMLYAWLLRGDWNRWQREEETRLFLTVVTVAVVVLALDLMALGNHSFGHAVRESIFQVVSIVTTTGFATEDYGSWPPFSEWILMLLMCIGGCAGSTAGGIKISRWLLFARVVRLEIISAFRPSQVIALRLNGDSVGEQLKLQTVFFVGFAAVMAALGTGMVSLLEPTLDLDSSFSATLATLFNIGPGIGAVGPTQNFAHLSAPTLALLTLFMLLGRLEFFAVLVLFAPSLWRKY